MRAYPRARYRTHRCHAALAVALHGVRGERDDRDVALGPASAARLAPDGEKTCGRPPRHRPAPAGNPVRRAYAAPKIDRSGHEVEARFADQAFRRARTWGRISRATRAV
jgi:hypothetical protein